MARDFKIELDNVEMINGSDDLLKDTKVTKVTLTGENKLNSLNSTFENCTELTAIEGDVNLDGVSDMTEMTLNTPLDEIKVTNPTEENIQTDNSLNQVANVKIGGTKYAKGGVQDVVGSLEWTAENFTYEDTILDNVYTNSSSIEDNKNITISDTLEQRATSFEVTGQTYENLVNGKATENLLDEMSMQQTEGKPTQFTPHMEQPVCVECIEGETYQNLVNGKGEYKLTDTFSTTWTESNNSFENMPSMIEIPEIWGNTVQGLANSVSTDQIVTSLVNTINTGATSYNERYMPYNNGGYITVSDAGMDINDYSLLTDECFIQLKPNTVYSYDVLKVGTTAKPHIDIYCPSKKIGLTVAGGNFTTDNTGKIIIYPRSAQDGKISIKLVEGNYDLVNLGWDYDLSYIQSVGDLYVDESGEPILDEEGNEQYKLEIESNDNINILDYELGYDIGLYNNDGTFDTSQTRERTGKCYSQVKEGKRYAFYNNNGGAYGQWFKIYAFDENKRFIKILSNSYASSIFYYTIPKNQGIKYIKICITDVWDKPHIIEDGKEIKFYGSGKGLTNKTTILMPQPLRRITTIFGVDKIDKIDRLYWDFSKGKYIIEQNIKTYNIGIAKDAEWGYVDINFPSDMPNSNNDYDSYPFILEGFKNVGWNKKNNVQNGYAVSRYSSDNYVLVIPSTLTMEEKISLLSNKNVYYWVNEPQYIETKILEKPSLETYLPTTYISTNSEVQPSQMTITNKQTILSPLSLQTNTDYTLQLDSVGKNDKPITVNLGGAETTIQPTNDTSKHHKVVVRTPSTLTTDKLDLSGEGVVVNDVMLFEGGGNEIKQEVEYVEGIQSIGELQEDGTYKIDILTRKKIDENVQPSNNYFIEGDIVDRHSQAGIFLVSLPISKFEFVSDSFNLVSDLSTCVNMYDYYYVNSGTKIWVNVGDRVTESKEVVRRLNLLFDKTNQSILLPQPLNKIGDIKDKFYWDDNKGHYCIEQNINENLEVLDTPNIIDLPHLNKKYSLDTYMPTTYVECTNSPMQPYSLLLEDDTVRYKATIEPSTLYTIQFNCIAKSTTNLTLDLGGTRVTVEPVIGINHVQITTPSELTSDRLFLIGTGIVIKEVIVNKGDMNQYTKYFDGEQSVGELQTDGNYKVVIKTNEGFTVTIHTSSPLTKLDKVYWNNIEKRYEIDRNGVIEVPTVEGDIINLPRLYQKVDTTINISTDNIEPSKIAIEYKDINNN